ncbi:alkaline phosphatase family protein [Demequina sp. NBRC 110056]|uniref:alkaline phosphatase family protein n=1 Tax=Demequina sp. NBRC 110056 TaxID=1570345 RepID=UPI000A06D2C1|nr:nucleotide pyrophosphatase/phosphodiesterase family protein [Demequina sp. NBRC 110056]
MTARPDLDALGLRLPDYGGRELGAVLPASLAAVGAGHVVRGRRAEEDRARLGIPRARHVVVVVLDGLGHHNLEARRGHAPFLRGAEQGVITAGYPTTTAASLGLFGTGQPAGQTGMTGYTALNPRTGALANLVSWEGAEPAETWQPRPSLLEAAAEAGFQVTTLGKRRFAGSGLTQAVLRGGQFVGAEMLADRIDVAVAAAARPGVSYCYWGEIDAAGHKHGWGSEEWVAALEDADRELSRLARSLPTGALMVVTADHGMVDVPGAPRWDIGTDDGLAQHVAIVAGEPRAVHVHLVPGAEPEIVAARWRDRLEGHAAVWTRDEARDARLFGEIDPALAPRIGDVVVAMAGRATVVDSRTQAEQSMRLVGMHGSLTPFELEVPLLLAGA